MHWYNISNEQVHISRPSSDYDKKKFNNFDRSQTYRKRANKIQVKHKLYRALLVADCYQFDSTDFKTFLRITKHFTRRNSQQTEEKPKL